MIVRIASVVLSLAGLLALLTGLLFWTGMAQNLIAMHMLLGMLAVASLGVIAIVQLASNAGGRMIAVSALITGVLMILIGMNQASLMVGDDHWVIQVVHLILGLATVGIGHIGAARYRKARAH